MAPSMSITSVEIYKHYFNDPTLSDLTIGLSDRTVHVHRILLCRRSKYFETLITGRFKEAGAKVVDLHEDDPEAMMAVLHYIYDKPNDDLYESSEAPLQFLAKVYVTADKYQVQGLLENVTRHIGAMLERMNPGMTDNWANEFLSAVEIMFAGTTTQDVVGRQAMVNFCVCYIDELKVMPRFSGILERCNDLAFQIIGHDKLSVMLDGSWYCNDEQHREAVPRCPKCKEAFGTASYKNLRHHNFWYCDECAEDVAPECSEGHKTYRVVWAFY